MSFQEKRSAQEYDRRLRNEGYPGNLLEIVLSVARVSETVIDIGSGTGFFSIPLLERGYRVTAIEPSREMIQILRKKISVEHRHRIALHHGDWESWKGEHHDLSICIHAIYGMKDIQNALSKMKRNATRSIVVVKADTGRRTLSSYIRQHFKETDRQISFQMIIADALEELKIDFNQMIAEQERIAHFKSIDDEAEYYCYHLGLNKEHLNDVKEIIRKNCERDKGGYLFRGIYRDAVFTFTT
jgi:FkbM family methyltransferase